MSKKFLFASALVVAASVGKSKKFDLDFFDGDEKTIDLDDLNEDELRGMYKKARLADCGGDLSKRWFVVYYVWDEMREALVRKRYSGGMNKCKTQTARQRMAQKYIQQINKLLGQGYTIAVREDRAEQEGEKGPAAMTIGQAVKWACKMKKSTLRKSTWHWFTTVENSFLPWLGERAKMRIKRLDATICNSYKDFLIKKGDKSNRTINNYMTTLATIVNYLIERDRKLFGISPVAHLKQLTVERSKKHAVYSPQQLSAIRQALEPEPHQLLLYINFIYYTLIRPNELLQLCIRDIDLQNDRIHISAGISKNRMGDYVNLFAPLKKIIIESGIMDYPRHFHIFSAKDRPDANGTSKNYFYRRHVKLLEKLKISDPKDTARKFDLYSYKHSGACNLYLQKLDIVNIQAQCRHQTLDQTRGYLRDLDLFRDKSFLDIKATF